jgi:hypothetical protein
MPISQSFPSTSKLVMGVGVAGSPCSLAFEIVAESGCAFSVTMIAATSSSAATATMFRMRLQCDPDIFAFCASHYTRKQIGGVSTFRLD